MSISLPSKNRATDLPPIPTTLRRFICQSLQASIDKGLLTRELVSELRGHIHSGESVDYSHYSAAFTCRYFMRNLATTYGAISQHVDASIAGGAERVVDIGCGSGASSAAVFLAIQQSSDNARPIHIDAVDSSSHQLETYNSVIVPWRSSAATGDTLTLIEKDVCDYLADGFIDADLIIASYLFCELPYRKSVELRKMLANVSSALVLVIDYDQTSAMSFIQLGPYGRRIYIKPKEGMVLHEFLASQGSCSLNWR